MHIVSMAKVAKPQERPKPPSFLKMKQDVENASDDDVVFNIENHDPSSKNSLAMIESFTELSSVEEKLVASDTASSMAATLDPEVDQTYKDTLQLLSCHKKLENASDLLQKDFESIEKLGKDVAHSISELQESAECILTDNR